MSKMTINFSNCENFSRFRNNRYIINMAIKIDTNEMLYKIGMIWSPIDEFIFEDNIDIKLFN